MPTSERSKFDSQGTGNRGIDMVDVKTEKSGKCKLYLLTGCGESAAASIQLQFCGKVVVAPFGQPPKPAPNVFRIASWDELKHDAYLLSTTTMSSPSSDTFVPAWGVRAVAIPDDPQKDKTTMEFDKINVRIGVDMGDASSGPPIANQIEDDERSFGGSLNPAIFDGEVGPHLRGVSFQCVLLKLKMSKFEDGVELVRMKLNSETPLKKDKDAADDKKINTTTGNGDDDEMIVPAENLWKHIMR